MDVLTTLIGPQLMPFESDHFGVLIANATSITEALNYEIIAAELSPPADCVCLRLPLHETEQIRDAEALGYRLTDIRVDLSRRATNNRFALASVFVRDDVFELMEIASTAHTDSRFYADPRLDDDVCGEFYAKWILNSMNGYADDVLVARQDGRARGYVTLHHGHDESRIGLIAVAADVRGEGHGAALVISAIIAAARANSSTISVATQARNLPALRMFARAGFVPIQTDAWLSKWFDR